MPCEGPQQKENDEMKTRSMLKTMAAFLAVAFIATTVVRAQDEMAEQKRRKRDAAGEMRGRRWGGGDPRGGPEMAKRLGDIKVLLEELKEEDPKEFERLMELRETDKRAFMQELQKLARAKGGGMGRGGPMGRGKPSPEEAKCHELSKLYHQTKDDEEKGRIKAELKAAVEAAFDKRLEDKRTWVQDMTKKLEEHHERIERTKAKRDEICKTRLDDLTRDPELRWDAGR